MTELRPGPTVAVEQLTAGYSAKPVLNGLTAEFPAGKVTVVLGGSGVGKSTLLNVIAGLLRARGGAVRIGGDDMSARPERDWDAARQRIGMLFQGAALLDSLSVFENLALPLRERTRMNGQEIADKVHAALAAVGLKEVDAILPGQLSGGMRKRVGLARALLKEPEILLCDEPFAGLDPISAKRIENLLIGSQRARGMTLIAVSHEPAFAMANADRALVLLPDGAVSGPPAELRESKDARVRAFLGGGIDATLLDREVEVEATEEKGGAA